ncbi:MAG: hypothetical protein KAG20_02620 [Cocleimonas sp.]|nr:hypothetical protein [Cocleimonas sp.]
MITSIVFGIVFLIQYVTVGTKQEINAFFGFMVVAAFFGVPYFVFFRSSAEKGKRAQKRTFISRRCQSCSSSQFKSYKDGHKCEHCGAVYY